MALGSYTLWIDNPFQGSEVAPLGSHLHDAEVVITAKALPHAPGMASNRLTFLVSLTTQNDAVKNGRENIITCTRLAKRRDTAQNPEVSPSPPACIEVAVNFSFRPRGNPNVALVKCPVTNPVLSGLRLSRENTADDTDLIVGYWCCK